jgi:valyl-tRNA synthetase
MKADWPVYRENMEFPAETELLETAMAAIKAIRTIRLEADAAPSKKLSAVILAEASARENLKAGARYIQKLANITEITFINNKSALPEDVMSAVIEGAELFIPSDELLDYDLELARLNKEKEKFQQEVLRVKSKLDNAGFVAKAPTKVIDEEKEKLSKYEDMLAKVMERLAAVEKKLG